MIKAQKNAKKVIGNFSLLEKVSFKQLSLIKGGNCCNHPWPPPSPPNNQPEDDKKDTTG